MVVKGLGDRRCRRWVAVIVSFSPPVSAPYIFAVVKTISAADLADMCVLESQALGVHTSLGRE